MSALMDANKGVDRYRSPVPTWPPKQTPLERSWPSQRGIHGGTSRNSSEDSLGLGQHLAHPNGSIAWDRHIFIIASGCNALLRNEWDEVWCPALDGVWLEGRVGSGGAAVIVTFALGARLDQWSVRRLAQTDGDAGTFLLQGLPSTGKGATRAVVQDVIIQLHALKVVQDLLASCVVVKLRVGFVLELAAQKPAVLLSQLLGFRDHAAAFAGLWGDDHLCAHKSHELAACGAQWRRAQPW